MAKREEKRNLETIPVGSLGMIPLEGCKSLGEKVDYYLVKWRKERESEHKSTLQFNGYERDSYIIDASFPRFGTGEGKGVLNQSVRGMDLYILVDVVNYSMTYSLFGRENHMSPDDHFANLKRLIQAAAGRSHRMSVIMPSLYGGRQHRRVVRESLDCAVALQELQAMGITNMITFDAHDPRLMNAVPLMSFDNVMPTYQVLKTLLHHMPELSFGKDDFMVISPD